MVLAIGDLTFLGAQGYWTFLIAAAIVGSGDFFASSQTALLAELVPPSQRAQVLAGYRFFVDIGALVGPLLLAGLMDAVDARAGDRRLGRDLAAGALIAKVGVPSSAAAASAGPAPARDAVAS